MSSIRVRAQIEGGVTNVRALISHPMETGQRRDQGGNTIPAHFITEVKAECNGRHVLTANWGPAISRNPYLSFQFEGAAAGDTLKLSWVDNNGESDTTEVRIS
ncbi:thiosulfate oxidation carrier complex protein SoxZ [Ectothiorhodospira shaposhnikovii]|uniref:thiosulfate oxidation carrier complex protein SoxZ n=1 Tax=Ectothiorhodospira shaposhnikovii TaxID=1054 RepID=UPI001904F4B2|nr:thiosulfate oxidation carrier complex protein SoxZ [Ectothiorhodospira shaposhnikovii]MBK1672396.1 thiosulfate oxidation carrier complex protein SoxZ [Ectothiorhodospira shaposhnikovii]